VEFGEGLLNKGKAKKREKRPLTQIEIMAAVEREKQEKKAARRAAKVRASPIRLDACRVSTKPARAISGDFYSPFFQTTLCQIVSLRDKVHANAFFFVFFYSRAALTSPLPYVSPSPLVANSQEAKAEARKERLDFELNGPNKQMTKKERRRLEAEGLN
jgi:hypothetical protein